ncbi:putative sodium/proline symporter [Selenomonas ruminantium subsp. lactilytica TAM6421]|uniref:Sodium/proline symporter n=1 Tax=Selenomonas ruminantium subsp. lactilytica (strain NBRC 103574 / TAM6421) TaxID=927704 RepID=I0GT20_SELRL|nr:sodium/proline symporter PutP [Selenomonas ruminantium]BAL83907.1 putative sodium/proline symporter [Selenomonas ruminantium subsp. lactilytica TAM6421]
MTDQLAIINTFILYIGLMMAIGVYYYRRTRNMSDYFLGNRKLGAWVTSMSAEASDMSGWMLMGVPGFAYLAGLNAGWIAVGIALGTWANWHFVAARLRKYTELAKNSLTVPQFLENRFEDNSGLLRTIPAVFILIFFTIYTSSGFVSSGRLFETVFGLPYQYAIFIGAGSVVFYTLVGGFLAVSRTDFIQGVMMFFAILVVPITAGMEMGGFTATVNAIDNVSHSMLEPFTKPDGSTLGTIELISLLAWGIGYFGQPHILVRFMAISSSKEIKQATRIAMTWVVLSLAAAVAVGMVGRVFLAEPLNGNQSETVFLVMTNELFPPIVAGLILSAVLAAIMSTASSQLLVAASAFAQDFYRTLLRKDASMTELIWISRASVLIIASLAIFIGLNPSSFILDMVAYAWAGFGAAFGPALLCALFWRRTTRNGVLAGIIVGGITVLVWKQIDWLGLYEIVPGFLLSLLAVYVVSRLDEEPAPAIVETFDAVGKSEI